MPNRIVMLCGGVLAAALAYGGLHVDAAGGQSAAALYSAAQAKRGADLYQSQQCALCHGANLEGGGDTPPLHGDDFVADFSNQSILALFDRVQKQMPPTNPGSLTPAQTADLLAYILSVNKYAAGDTELSADRDKLKAIQLPKPSN